MEEVKNGNLKMKMKQEDAAREIQNKKNTFTLVYILVGILIIAVLAILLYAFIVS